MFDVAVAHSTYLYSLFYLILLQCDLYFYYCWLSKMDVNVDGWQEQEANESEKYVEEQIIDMTIAMYLY